VTIHFATWALGVEFGVSRVEPLDWGYPLQRHCVMNDDCNEFENDH
jgi:hypothetical protein